MGSPAKANKILGDEVLKVEETEAARRSCFKFPPPPTPTIGDPDVETVEDPYTRDSIWIRPKSNGAVWIV
jgi:hypothetical protein